MNHSLLITVIFILIQLFHYIEGHGMVLEPVARGSRWRFNESAPRNYNDAELYCGGRTVQWNQNNGKCGICGDNFADSRPRRHEIGGEFGEPVIVGVYKRKSILTSRIDITANHKGKFWFELCNMDGRKNEAEECFNTKMVTKFDEEFWYLKSNESKIFDVELKVPDMKCQHCIFRWNWSTGNNWGDCGNGTGAVGCGNQEHFRTCSDISIL
uniref:CSON004461 protein n=1 Tax=Culicoides sonorensis TaxID=179676 RepID=A0A336LYJ2_CULSO